MPEQDKLRDHILQRLKLAEKAAKEMQLERSIQASGGDFVQNYQRLPESIADIPFTDIATGFGKKVWSSILFVDMRNSSKIAELHSERDVYLTMHGLLTALSWIVREHHGLVVGFRGDGLFAGFGIGDTQLNESSPPSAYQEHLRNCIACGKMMLESIDSAIRPSLQEFISQVPPIQLGVGIDANNVVVTRIGLFSATELTAYGPAVNIASKLSSLANDRIGITKSTYDILPSTKGGRWGFTKRDPQHGREWGLMEFQPNT